MHTRPPLLFRLVLGASSSRSGQAHDLWATQVLRPQAAPRPLHLTQDGQALEDLFGQPCQVGVEAQVPRDHIGPMMAAMHLTLAMHLRAAGHRADAEVIEHAWAVRRQRSSFRSK